MKKLVKKSSTKMKDGGDTAKFYKTNRRGKTKEISREKYIDKVMNMRNPGRSKTTVTNNPETTNYVYDEKGRYPITSPANTTVRTTKTKGLGKGKSVSRVDPLEKGGAIKAITKKTMSKKPMMKSGGAKKSLVKAQDGLFTPYGRIKSNKTRNVNIDFSGSSSDVSKTKKDGTTVTKSIKTTQGYAPRAEQSKIVTDKLGNVISKKEKDINPNKADKKINRVVRNVGRNENDTWSYKKGGSTFGMLSVKAGVDKNPKATAADRIAGAKMNKKKMGGVTKLKKK